MSAAAELLESYIDDPLTLATHELTMMAATWPADVRDEVLLMLGELAIACSRGSQTYHLPAAEFLSSARKLIRLAAERAADYDTPIGA